MATVLVTQVYSATFSLPTTIRVRSLMSLVTELSKPFASPNSKGKAKEKRQRGDSKPQTERLKTVVRRLPPNLPEDVFWQSVQQWVTEDTAQWRAYYKGKFRTR